MKHQARVILHAAVRIQLFSMAIYSLGYVAGILSDQELPAWTIVLAAVCILSVFPAALSVWAFRLSPPPVKIDWRHAVLHTTVAAYCGVRLIVPFEPRWDFSSLLAGSLAATSGLVLAMGLVSKIRFKPNSLSRPVTGWPRRPGASQGSSIC